MKMSASLLAAACATALLGGCAAQSSRLTSHSAPQAGTHEVAGNYVALVNQEARRRGVQVEWVNPPSKRDRGTLPKRRPLERNDAASRAER